MLMKGIKPLRIILILTFVLNLFFSNGTTPLIDWWIIHITREGLTQAVHYSLRLVFLVAAAIADVIMAVFMIVIVVIAHIITPSVGS